MAIMKTLINGVETEVFVDTDPVTNEEMMKEIEAQEKVARLLKEGYTVDEVIEMEILSPDDVEEIAAELAADA